jgi:HD superfamily phosphohydrolase
MHHTSLSLLSELYQQQQVNIRDPLWKDIQISEAFRRILHTRQMQKLGRIKQLGPTFHLYPGAVHTRLDHSLGVYHVSFLILASLLKQASNKKIALPITSEGMKTFLCASLLHDIGHFPFAHSLKELPLKEHEAIAAELILTEKPLTDAILDANIDPVMVASIIDENRKTTNEEVTLYRSILSGTLDPDKLDYLNRDAFFCGVPYGTQDVSYITDKLTVVDDQLALDEKALSSIEHLLFSKYLMYKNVYWHKTTRSATAMIKKAVLCALSDGMLFSEQLYRLDDEQFFLLPFDQNKEYSSLFHLVRNNQLYHCMYEKPCEDELKELAQNLEDRLSLESKLADRLGIAPHQVIIDIPESISFESEIPIVKDDKTVHRFTELDQLFSHDIGKAFTKSLRKFRIFTPPFVTQEQVKAALEY